MIRYWWLDLKYGIGNLIRWFPLIWRDCDSDWSYLAEIMEYKLRRMARVIRNGHHVGRERDARNIGVCAALLKRLTEDEYFSNAGYDPVGWSRLSDFEQYRIVGHARKMEQNDQRYLGLLFGKYLRNWWD